MLTDIPHSIQTGNKEQKMGITHSLNMNITFDPKGDFKFSTVAEVSSCKVSGTNRELLHLQKPNPQEYKVLQHIIRNLKIEDLPF